MSENFHENLKTARLLKGVSQKDVAENIGVAKSTYSLYESGNREPNVLTIKKIASYLDVSANSLLGLEESLPTIAAHLDGSDYTEEQWKRIASFAEFIKQEDASKLN